MPTGGCFMPKVAKDTAPQHASQPGYEARLAELDGYTVAFEEFSEGGDFSPLFRGLPDDRCQSPHWGVVVKGSITFRSADGGDHRRRRGLLRAARPHAGARRRDRGGRVRPYRGASADHGGGGPQRRGDVKLER